MPQNQKRGNQSRNQTNRRPRNHSNNSEPGTPQLTAPRFLTTRNQHSPTSASPATLAIQITAPTIPAIQQSQTGEPLYLVVSAPLSSQLVSQPHGYVYHVPTPSPVIEWRRQPVDDRSEPELVHQTPLAATTLYCYYPEDLYLSSILPTRSPVEIEEFLSHC